MYSDRKFMIFNVSELSSVNFDEVLETSADTIRTSVNGTKTFVKWQSESIPSSVGALQTKQGPYTYEEMSTILSTSEWQNPEN